MTAITLDAPVVVGLLNKDLIEATLWDRLVGRIVKDADVDRETAEQIMDQALGFLKLCASDPGKGYSPSLMVDIGWHTFVLYTREYADFCNRIAGFFIHHQPSDLPGADYSADLTIADTVEAMTRFDIEVIPAMWDVSAKCGPYCNKSCSNYCSDSSTGSPQG